MRIIDNYLDKWISKKAIAMLKHNFAMCGFQTIVEEKGDYYDISLKRYHREEKPKYFFTLYSRSNFKRNKGVVEMNIAELAKEVEKAYKECIKHKNSYDCYKGLGSKAYAKRRIEILQDELLQMKEDLMN